MDTSWVQDAYQKANDGHWEEFTAHVADGYVHHLPALGVVWHGRDEAVAGLQQMYADFDLKQTATTVTEHGPFLIVTIEMSSSMRQGITETVHVYRTAEDKIVELWVVSDPVPSP